MLLQPEQNCKGWNIFSCQKPFQVVSFGELYEVIIISEKSFVVYHAMILKAFDAVLRRFRINISPRSHSCRHGTVDGKPECIQAGF